MNKWKKILCIAMFIMLGGLCVSCGIFDEEIPEEVETIEEDLIVVGYS